MRRHTASHHQFIKGSYLDRGPNRLDIRNAEYFERQPHERRLCTRCDCELSRFNPGDLCGPCRYVL